MTVPNDSAANRPEGCLGRRAFLHLAASAAFSVSLLADARAAVGQEPGASPTTRTAPSLKDMLGFIPGEARKLVAWKDVIRVFRELERVRGDRMKVDALGTATEGAPYITATFTSPENRARLEELHRIQDTLADPRKMTAGAEADLLRRGRNFVVITCGIHSTEVASTLAGLHIAHRLATGDDDLTRRILDECVVVLCPSINPDGVDIVKNWYDSTLGQPYEGTSPPRLYQKYVGHDDNRDWVAFTQAESRLTVDKVLNVYKPQILHDIHQMGGTGPRMFVPPYLPPVEPNVPPEIIEGFTTLGRAMQAEMTAQGKTGVVSGALFDGWTPLRAYIHYHHGIRILSETAASGRLATPTTVTPDARWLTASDNFPAPWPGGVWGVGEATDYMTTAAFALLRHAAENRENYLKRYLTVAKRAVQTPGTGQRAAFLIPPAPNRPALLSILRRAGVEVTLSKHGFRHGSDKYPKETAIVRADQPYIAFAAALLVPTSYPDLTDQNGRPIPPYDVTAHCLSLLLDVPVREAAAPFTIPSGTPVELSALPEREIPPAIRPAGISAEAQKTRVGIYQSWVPSMDEGWTRFALEQSNIPYTVLHDSDVRTSGAALRTKADTLVFADQSSRSIRSGYSAGRMPPEYTGGLGERGEKALREFIEEGGTAVFLNSSCEYAINAFDLPVRDISADARADGLYLPGALLRLELDRGHPVAKRMPRGDTAAWVEDSPIFESLPNTPRGIVSIVARYPTRGGILLSGWLRGSENLAGKAALVEVKVGKGRCILFGFRPQYRGHSFVTYPLFANALARK